MSRDTKFYLAGAAILAGFIMLFVFVIFPWTSKAEAAGRANRIAKEKALASQGFGQINVKAMKHDYGVGFDYFNASVGNCTAVLVFVSPKKNGYRTMVFDRGYLIYTDMAGIRKLSTYKPCFS